MLLRALSLEIGVTTLRSVISEATGGACGLTEPGRPEGLRLTFCRRLSGKEAMLT